MLFVHILYIRLDLMCCSHTRVIYRKYATVNCECNQDNLVNFGVGLLCLCIARIL